MSQQLTFAEGLSLAVDAFKACGCEEQHAKATAENMLLAEQHRSHSHGLFRLPGYLKSLKSGKIKGNPQSSVTLSGVIMKVESDHAMAPYIHAKYLDDLVSLTKNMGIGLLAIREVHHFSSLWIEASYLAERGLCTIVCTSYLPSIAPFGAKKIFGTNPMAFAWPRGHKPPLVIDQASAVMARGDIMIAEMENRTLPDGTGVDKSGKPTNNAKAVLEGAQLAFGGYKGANIALMIELLAGPLIGETTSISAAKIDNKDGGPPSGGEFILAIDPAHFGDIQQSQKESEAMFTEIINVQGAVLPGDRRYGRLANNDGTFKISQKVLDEITALSGVTK